MRSLKVLCGAAALVAFLAPGAHADEWNKKTYLTFSGPVQIPGATLQAGTYTFEIANPNTTRHVIRVSEKESGKPVGLFMTIPNERMEAPSDNLVMFSERPAGAAPAVQVWFYPGNRTGEEFVYPRSQAMAIAKANKTSVLATGDENAKAASEADRMAAMKGAAVGRIDESGKMTDEDTKTADTRASNEESPKPAPAPANTVDGSRPSRAEAPRSATTADAAASTRAKSAERGVATSGARDNAVANRSARRQLPRTGSNLALVQLLSVFALAAAFGVRRLRRGYVHAR